MVALVSMWVLVIPTPAFSAEGCNPNSGMDSVDLKCERTKEEVRKLMHEPDSPYKYRVTLVCVWGGEENQEDICGAPAICSEDPLGFQYQVWRALKGDDNWSLAGLVCLGHPDELTNPITEVEVRRAFKELTWPEAELIIQPPDGETLVNLPTIFYTPDTGPITQTVTLLGIDVEIEATPVSWTWHWAKDGDDATSSDLTASTTNHPGAPHPHETITHAYTRAGTVRPSVDVTYTGRFRIDNGEWTDITENHTVPGTPQTLTALQARPVLIP